MAHEWGWEKTERLAGEAAGIERARRAMASAAIGREFGESMEDYLERGGSPIYVAAREYLQRKGERVPNPSAGGHRGPRRHGVSMTASETKNASKVRAIRTRNPGDVPPYKFVMRDMQSKWRAIPKGRAIEILMSPGTFDGGAVPEHKGHEVAVIGVMPKARKAADADYSVPVWDYNVGRLDTRRVLERIYRDEAFRETKSSAYKADHAIVDALNEQLGRRGARAANPDGPPGAPAYVGAAIIAAEAERGRIVWYDQSCRDALVPSLEASQAEGGAVKVLTSYVSPDGETWIEHHTIAVAAETKVRAANPPPSGASRGYEATWGVYHPEDDEEFYDDLNQATGRALALSAHMGVPVRVRMYAGDDRGGWLWGAMLEVSARDVPYEMPPGARRMTRRDFDRAVGRADNPADLEGPFRFPTGKVLYYDRREGRYYDAGSDVYLDHEEAAIATGVTRPRPVDMAAIKRRVMK